MFDPMPDFMAEWWWRNWFDICLAVLVFFCVSLGFVIGTAGREKRDG